MSHYRLDTAKYERHLAQFKTNAARMGQLLDSTGSLARAQRALRDAVQAGRISVEELDSSTAILDVIAEQMAPDTLHLPDSAVEVAPGKLAGLVDLLRKSFQLMRFSNFVIPPGGASVDRDNLAEKCFSQWLEGCVDIAAKPGTRPHTVCDDLLET